MKVIVNLTEEEYNFMKNTCGKYTIEQGIKFLIQNAKREMEEDDDE